MPRLLCYVLDAGSSLRSIASATHGSPNLCWPKRVKALDQRVDQLQDRLEIGDGDGCLLLRSKCTWSELPKTPIHCWLWMVRCQPVGKRILVGKVWCFSSRFLSKTCWRKWLAQAANEAFAEDWTNIYKNSLLTPDLCAQNHPKSIGSLSFCHLFISLEVGSRLIFVDVLQDLG